MTFACIRKVLRYKNVAGGGGVRSGGRRNYVFRAVVVGQLNHPSSGRRNFVPVRAILDGYSNRAFLALPNVAQKVSPMASTSTLVFQSPVGGILCSFPILSKESLEANALPPPPYIFIVHEISGST